MIDFNCNSFNNFRYHDTIEAYDPIRDVWENVGEMPSSRSWLSCVPLMVRYCKLLFSRNVRYNSSMNNNIF